jgi:hypothetical protein
MALVGITPKQKLALVNLHQEHSISGLGKVIVPLSEYKDWLDCQDPERARLYLQLYPAELMTAQPAPKPVKEKKIELNGTLF